MRNFAITTTMTLSLIPATVNAQKTTPVYSLDVQLDPSVGGIAVVGRLDHACAGDSVRLYLNKTFVVEEFRDTAGPIPVRFDSAGPSMPYAAVTRRLLMGRPATCAVSFRYRGVIRDLVSDVNIISPKLIELASYAGWYLESPEFAQARYDVSVTLPLGFVLTGNGRVVSVDTASGHQTVHFRDAAPGFDIVLIAAPEFHRVSGNVGKFRVTLYAPPADSTADAGTLADLLDALRRYRAWYGSAAGGGELRIVYSARGGWGYSRIPVIVGSASYRIEQLAGTLGRMRVMEGAAHELGHFWWSLADAGTPDDWINEGLAEYSAFAVATAEFGPSVRDALLAGYRRDAARTQTTATIATTTTESPDRYVNRYEKPVLLLAELEDAYGSTRVHAALRAVYGRFRGTRSATTETVLSVIRRALGSLAAARLKACLVDVAWRDRCPYP